MALNPIKPLIPVISMFFIVKLYEKSNDFNHPILFINDFNSLILRAKRIIKMFNY